MPAFSSSRRASAITSPSDAWPADDGTGATASMLSSPHFLLTLSLQSLDEFVEVAFKHLFQLMQGHADTMIGYPILREVVGANLLASLASAHLSLAILCDFRFLLLPLRLDD